MERWEISVTKEIFFCGERSGRKIEDKSLSHSAWWGKFESEWERERSCPPRNGPFSLNTHGPPPPCRLETVKQRHNLTRSCPFRLLPLHFVDKSWRDTWYTRLAHTKHTNSHTPTFTESEIENLRLSWLHCALRSLSVFFQRHFVTQGNATDFDNNEAGKSNESP